MSSDRDGVSRRTFLRNATAGAAGIAIVPRHVLGRGFTPPSDTLNIAGVGVGGMGRSNLVNLDRYSLDLEYDRGRIPEAPIDIQFEAHAGSYAELATRVTATRTEGLVTFATDTFRLGPGLSASAGGLVRVD